MPTFKKVNIGFIVLAVVALVAWLGINYLLPSPSPSPPPPPPPILQKVDDCYTMKVRASQQHPGDSISVTLPQGTIERVGISEGSFVFGAGANKDAKCAGSLRFSAKDYVGAQAYWTQAVASLQKPPKLDVVSNDAETLIYRENSYVLASGRPYITAIVGTILTGDYAYIGHDFLQGAYVEQEEFNRHNSTPLLLLIANFSSTVRETLGLGQQIEDEVAEQVLNVANKAHAMGIVLGLPFMTGNTLTILNRNQNNIPIVLSGPFSESQILTTGNIFPIAASIEREGQVGALYARRYLNVSNPVIFVDHADAYSDNLARAFQEQFSSSGRGSSNVIEEVYTVGQATTFKGGVQDVLGRTPAPDLIYFAGNSKDANGLLEELGNQSPSFNLPLMGGDALYELGGYSGGHYQHLDFTSFAYPDEWTASGFSQHPFNGLYRLLFAGWPPNKAYGYSRPDNDTILAYDALSVLMEGCQRAIVSGTSVEQALTTIRGQRAFQGFSGRIAFGDSRNNKAVVVLSVDQSSLTHEEIEDGCLLVTPCTSR